MARCSRSSPQSLHWEAIMEDRVVVGVTRPDWLTLSERRGPLNEHDGGPIVAQTSGPVWLARRNGLLQRAESRAIAGDPSSSVAMRNERRRGFLLRRSRCEPRGGPSPPGPATPRSIASPGDGRPRELRLR